MRFLKVLGYIIFFGSGLYLYVMSLIFYYSLWDLLGLIIAIVVFPAVEIFPIVSWIITKQFPWVLFLIWGIGWIGMILASVGKAKEEEYYFKEATGTDNKKEKFRGISVAALISGILSLMPNLLYSQFEKLFGENNSYSFIIGFIQFGLIITAIICGSVDLKNIKKDPTKKKGKGLDIAGVVLGSLSIFWQLFLLVTVLLFLL